MQIDIAALYHEELFELNRAVDILGIPDDVFRECGSCRVSMMVATYHPIPGERTALNPLSAYMLSEANAKFEKICRATPHVPRRALAAMLDAYGGFLIQTNNGQDIDGLDASGGDAMSAIKTLMCITMLRGLALGHAGLEGGVLEAVQENIARKQMQSLIAEKRHAENRAMKKDVFAWLDANMPNFKSMDSAAEAIAGKVAPVKFRTARDWVGEWKKLRSTGTP